MDTHHQMKPRGGVAAADGPTAAAGPPESHDGGSSSSSSRRSRWLAVFDGSKDKGPNSGRWLRRMLVLVIVLHILLIAAVLYASPFDGHHGNHAHQNLPQAPEDAAAESMAAAAGVMAEANSGRGSVTHVVEGNEEEAAGVASAARAAAAPEPSPRPPMFEECGLWQEGYMDLHRRILAGEAPQRYLVAVAYKGGLADQLVGIVTAFYWALLTDRAFQLTVGHQKLPHFERAFDAPYINWTRPLDPKEMTEHLYAAHRGPRHFPEGVDTEQYGHRYLVNNNRASEFLLHENLWAANEQPTLFVASNRGRSYRLFDNPHHRQQLAAMGLRPETAFGCAFHFLFAPNAATLATHAGEIRRLLVHHTHDNADDSSSGSGNEVWHPPTRPAMIPPGQAVARRMAVEAAGGDPGKTEAAEMPPLRIGIQIRVGDFIFKSKAREQGLKLEDYKGYFECAEQIENHQRGHPDRKVLWYLISDSSRLRQLALEHYGADKLVTQTSAAHHIVCGKGTKCKDLGDDEQVAALTAAVGDMLTLSLTDFQVLTDRSGFGKVASAIGMGWHTVWFGGGYPVHRKKQAETRQAKRAKKRAAGTPQCGPKRYISNEKLADKWSGI